MKMVSKMLTHDQHKAMKKALKAASKETNGMFKIKEETKTTFIVTLPDGVEVFRSMRGSPRAGGHWLTRYAENLFLEA